ALPPERDRAKGRCSCPERGRRVVRDRAGGPALPPSGGEEAGRLDRQHPARSRGGRARPAARGAPGDRRVVRAALVLRLRAGDVQAAGAALDDAPARRSSRRAPAPLRPAPRTGRRALRGGEGRADPDGQVADAVRPALADRAHPRTRGDRRRPQAEPLNTAGRHLSAARGRVAAEDLAWLGAIAAGLWLVVAFAWITPHLVRFYPSPPR